MMSSYPQFFFDIIADTVKMKLVLIFAERSVAMERLAVFHVRPDMSGITGISPLSNFCFGPRCPFFCITFALFTAKPKILWA